MRFWAPLPLEATQIHSLIMKYIGSTRNHIELAYNIQLQTHLVGFGNLERWAQEADYNVLVA